MSPESEQTNEAPAAAALPEQVDKVGKDAAVEALRKQDEAEAEAKLKAAAADAAVRSDKIKAKRAALVAGGVPQKEADALTDAEIEQCPEPDPNDAIEDANATAAIQVDPPAEADKPHPAIAELEGPASDLGHTIDVTDAPYRQLPVGQIVIDDHGRVWRLRESQVEVIEEREGDDEPVSHTEHRSELVFVGRLLR